MLRKHNQHNGKHYKMQLIISYYVLTSKAMLVHMFALLHHQLIHWTKEIFIRHNIKAVDLELDAQWEYRESKRIHLSHNIFAKNKMANIFFLVSLFTCFIVMSQSRFNDYGGKKHLIKLQLAMSVNILILPFEIQYYLSLSWIWKSMVLKILKFSEAFNVPSFGLIFGKIQIM